MPISIRLLEPGVCLRGVPTNLRAMRLSERTGFVRAGPTDQLPDGREVIELVHRFEADVPR